MYGNRRRSRSTLLAPLTAAVLLLTSGAPRAVAADGDAKPNAVEISVSYFHDIRPILQEHCQGCHQPAKAGGKLVVTSYEKLMEGAGDDLVVVPGKPEESVLVEEITPEDGKASMPKKAPPLESHQLDLITRWIAEGAEDDTPESARPVEYSADHPPLYENRPVLAAIDYSPDGSQLAVGGYHEVLLHKADGSGLLARLVGVSERIESLAFSPDGKSLAAVGGTPGLRGEVQIWDVEKKKLVVSRTLTFDTLFGVSWSPDGKLVSFGCTDNSVRAIDAASGAEVLFQGAHNDWVLGTVFSTDASHLVSVSRDRSMKLIKVDTQQFIDNITSITPGALKGGLQAVDRHPQKDEILVGGADGVPKIYRMYREKARKIGDDYNLIRAFEALPGRIFSTEFNADGTRIVAGSSLDASGEVRVYQTEDGKLLWKSQLPTPIYAVAFRPDGKEVAACGFSGDVLLFDGETGEERGRFVPVPIEDVAKVARDRTF